LVLTLLFIKKGIFDKKILSFSINLKKLSKEFVKYCSPLLAHSIIGIVAGLFDIWLLQKMAGSIQTGFYGLACSLAAMCFLFTSAMTPIITREFAKSYEQKDIDKMKKLFFRFIPMLYSLAAYFGVFISIQSASVLDIFTDDKFKDAYLVLVVMAFYPIHQTYGQLSGSIFYATGQTKLIRNVSFISQPIGMALSFGFVYIFDLGAVGLALKMIIGQLIAVNIQLYLSSKFLDFKMKHFILHQIYSVLFFAVLAIVSSSIVSFESTLIYFLVSGSIYTTLVILLAYFFPQIFAITREEIRKASQIFFKKRSNKCNE